MLSPWTKLDDLNPILAAGDETFHCPLADADIAWRAKDVFNPAAIVHGGRVALLFRAEDEVGPFAGTSRIGLAWSDDGRRFEVEPEPVLFPQDDPYCALEWPGGCEDPRVVGVPEDHTLPGADAPGGYLMFYTAYDGRRARLMVASSHDLCAWRKHGAAFDGGYADTWAKAASAVCHFPGDGSAHRMARIDGRFWMYWGEGHIFAATSDDGVAWDVLEYEQPADREFTPGVGNRVTPGDPPRRVPRPLVSPRPGQMDGYLCEPGPPAVLTDSGIVLIYNAAAQTDGPRQPGTPERGVRYCPARLTFDPASPAAVIHRDTEPLFVPDRPYERTGQVNAVCFVEGLVRDPLDPDAWLLYYGTADSKIAVARC